jgi:hypothetical protein
MKSITNKSNKNKVKFNKKSKKKQTKKKSLKSVKRVQRGGLSNEEVFKKIKIEKPFESEYPACFSLIREFSQSPEQLQPRVKMDGTPLKQVDFWTYEAKIKATDDFEVIFKDPLGWYQHKNPEFKILKRPTEEEMEKLPFKYTPYMYIGDGKQVRVPEYRFLVAQMIKDLLVALYLGKMPQLHKNNKGENTSLTIAFENIELNSYIEEARKIKEKIFKILIKIEENIRKEYVYIDFIDYLHDYLDIFSGITYDYLKEKFFLKKQILFTPFIIIPTLTQIDFKKVINLVKAPLLNFRMLNRRMKTHNRFRNPYFEIFHDLNSHCNWTHNINKYITGSSYKTYNDKYFLNSKNITFSKEEITKSIGSLRSTYQHINESLKKIEDLYNYETKNEEKYSYAIFLFFILHEIFGVNIIIDNKLLNVVINNKPSILGKPGSHVGIYFDSKITSILIKSSNGTLEETPLTYLYDKFISELKNKLKSQSSPSASASGPSTLTSASAAAAST